VPSFLRRRIARLLAIAAVAAGGIVGCASVPDKRQAVDAVTMEGTQKIDDDDIADHIATAPSPKFLGLFRGLVYDYEILDRLTLQRDLARVERYYRARGYYDAHARAGRVIRVDPKHVRVVIVVDEGRPVLLRTVRIEGNVPPALRSKVQTAANGPLPKDMPFDEDKFVESAERTQRTLEDAGYAHARITRDAAVDVAAHSAVVVLTIDAGEPEKFGHVEIQGLGGLPEAPVRRALDITEGEPYSKSAIESARQAVLDLGVFSAAEIEPVLDEKKAPPGVVPLIVRLEPSKLRTVRLGGGAEFDSLKTDVHALAGWEDHNFFGGLRSYTVTLKPGVVLYPLRIGNFVTPERLLPEFRLRNEFRQPGFLEARTNAIVRPELNLFAVLLPNASEVPGAVPGYLEFKIGAGVDRTFWKFYASLMHNVQVEQPFTYVGDRDPALRTLVLSFPELVTNLDFSDSRVKPHKGVFIGNSLQVAGGPFGGDATDVRVHPDVRGYVPLGPRITFATRASFGLLFPMNYGDSLDDDEATQRADSFARVRDLQVVFFRGFFAGGPSSDRGYPLRSIGPYQIVASPAFGGAASLAACATASAANSDCRITVGGTTLWEASAEVRFVVKGPVSMATFCDAADVSARLSDFRFTHPHLSCGLGGRYDTPVGPIRLDVGYRIPGLQVMGPPDPSEQEPSPFLGLPIALAFGIGEAY
jgi:outer membrane protein assembly factor BamA